MQGLEDKIICQMRILRSNFDHNVHDTMISLDPLSHLERGEPIIEGDQWQSTLPVVDSSLELGNLLHPTY